MASAQPKIYPIISMELSMIAAPRVLGLFSGFAAASLLYPFAVCLPGFT
jgi:hypothetical protein